MTDETKKLFDAPWRATDLDYVEDANGFYVCECGTHLTASNIARLPELYDALANAVRDACQDCVDQVYDHPTGYDPVKQGCLFKDKNCCEMCRSWIELLRKVRDGK